LFFTFGQERLTVFEAGEPVLDKGGLSFRNILSLRNNSGFIQVFDKNIPGQYNNLKQLSCGIVVVEGVP